MVPPLRNNALNRLTSIPPYIFLYTYMCERFFFYKKMESYYKSYPDLFFPPFLILNSFLIDTRYDVFDMS